MYVCMCIILSKHRVRPENRVSFWLLSCDQLFGAFIAKDVRAMGLTR